MLLQKEYNEEVVLQQGGDSSVHNRMADGKSDRYMKISQIKK